MKVLLIGTGRMAFHLGHALKRAGLPFAGVAGRDGSKAGTLASTFGCAAFSLTEALPAADIRIIAVRDDAIGGVSRLLPKEEGSTTVHTSGARPWDLIEGQAHRGVLWPVQSFSPGEPMDFSAIPLVIDAEDDRASSSLNVIARALGGPAVELAHAQRTTVHAAAVLAGNFPVWLLMEAEKLLRTEGIPPTIIHPLWERTTERAVPGTVDALTGPARRGDIATIRSHMDRLASHPDLRRAYAQLSGMILKAYGHPTDGIEDVQGDPR